MSNTRTLPVNIYFNDTLVNSTRTLQVNIYFNDTLVNSTRTLQVNIYFNDTLVNSTHTLPVILPEEFFRGAGEGRLSILMSFVFVF